MKYVTMYQYDYEKLKSNSLNDKQIFNIFLISNECKITQKQINDYYCKSFGIIIGNKKDYTQLLEEIFEKFNLEDRPNAKYNKNVGVGDIVVIENKQFVCANSGWIQVNYDLNKIPEDENFKTY